MAFTLGAGLDPAAWYAGNAMAIFYLSRCRYPGGRKHMLLSLSSTLARAARSVQVELIEFSGVDQTSPLYFGTATDNVYGATDRHRV